MAESAVKPVWLRARLAGSFAFSLNWGLTTVNCHGILDLEQASTSAGSLQQEQPVESARHNLRWQLQERRDSP
jgi:hypothetical protein